VCAAESYPQDEDSVRLLALALLTVLNEDGAPVTGSLWRPVFETLQVLCDRYDKWFSETWERPTSMAMRGAISRWPG
jgi:hypothetical protein